MAEETNQQTQEQQQQQPAPAFDMDALATQVSEKLKDAFKQQAPPPQPPRPQVVQQPPVVDPVADLLRPYLEPVARQAAIASDSADDAAEFYGAHAELEKEERLEIEKRFKALKAQGLPLKREDIYNHYVGENVEKVVEKRIKKRDEQVTRAANASTVGSGSPDRAPAQIVDARSMTLPDLEKALAGQSF